MNKLHLQAPICHTGYGQAGYNIGLHLSRMCDTTIFPMGPVGNFPNINEINSNTIYSKPGQFNADTPSIKIWHQNDLFSHLSRSRRIGFPIFELNRFTDVENSSLLSCDEIYVASKWAAGIIKSQTCIDARIVPLGVDTDIFYPSYPNISRHEKTIFLNCGKWEIRKGHDVLVDIFNKAFKPNDNVELWMMCDNIVTPEVNSYWESLYKSSKLGDKVKIIHYQASHEDVARVMKQADCGVFISRAEGWNLELLEMMACGKSVIATSYSAHTEYCNTENAQLIDIDNLESAYDGIWFKNQGFWANIGQPQIDQAVEFMRTVHKKKMENGPDTIYNIQGVLTASNFTWKNSARRILDEINN